METKLSKLKEKPFSLVPSPEVFYQGPGVKHSYNTLLNGVKAGHKLMLVAGEQGSGKTLYALRLQADLQADPTYCCICPPCNILSLNEMQRFLCAELGLNFDTDQIDVSQNEDASDTLQRFLSEGESPIKTVVIIIDEAQNLSAEILKSLVMMTDNEQNKKTKIRRTTQLVLLAGYGEELKVEPKELASIEQRISLQCSIEPLHTDQIAGYIKYQLQTAGKDYTQHFMVEACDRIFYYTKGNVRAVNQLCNKVLMQAAVDYVNVITPEQVDTAQCQENLETNTIQVLDGIAQSVELQELSEAANQQLIDKELEFDKRLLDKTDNKAPRGIPILTNIRSPSANYFKRVTRKQILISVAVASIFGLLYMQLLHHKKSIQGLEEKLVVLNDKLASDNHDVTVMPVKDDSLSSGSALEHPVFDDPAVFDESAVFDDQVVFDAPPPIDNFDNVNDQISIEELFIRADSQTSDDHLTEPEGDNAVETYQQILEQEPENKRAQQSLTILKENFIKWAKESEEEKKIGWAISQYKRALVIVPEDKDLTQKISQLRKRLAIGDDSEIRIAMLEKAKEGETASLKELLETGLSPGSRDDGRNTPLILASERGHLGVVELLLVHNANVNRFNKNGDTALINAVAANHISIAKILIANQAKVSAANKEGITALMTAAINGHTSLITLLGEAGARLELRTNDGKTALAVAAENGQREVVSLLLEQGAKVDSNDNESWTPLMHAVINNHTDVVQSLLNYKADVNSTNREKNTPLMLAAEKGYESIAKMLLDQGADKLVKNAKGLKAIDLAKQNQHESIEALLKQSFRRKIGHNIFRN